MKKRFLFTILLAGFIGAVFAMPGIIQLEVSAASTVYKEVYDAGLTKYVGSNLVKSTSKSTSMGIVTYHYEPSTTGRGPLCMRGDEFIVEARDGKWGNNNLLIFLEGGGVCLDEICLATPKADLTLQLMNTASIVGMGGVLDKYNSDNPMKDYNVVHIP